MLDPRRLKVLVALADHGTLARAAEALHYSQGTISHHLTRLESETGAVLTQRVGRGLRLTPDGAALARRGTEILALLSRAEEELTTAVTLRRGRIRLAAFPSATAALLPPVIDRLAHAHPGLELDLTEAEPPQARQLLRAGAVDLALVFGHGEETDEAAYSSVELGEDATHLVTPATGALAGAQGLGELRDAPWIAGCPQCRTHLLDLAAEAGFAPRVRFATDDYVAVQHLVAAGHAVAILPALALTAYQHPGVRARRLPGATRHVGALSLGAPPHPPAIQACLAALAAVRHNRVDEPDRFAARR